ncbi:assimilatory sulfite reductase (NADPH) flavoprotein subunit [Alkalihalobacillus pseudalcaliphilus]|uniref:assimilatory sulfite reductase (NADPH) flavoprotein subunit n=1 Tax=Alkalihalobacillus pseudalcaliphilus TaxID=79884 RepID=UPI00064DF5BA|nr:assimilatory sulfite reductase (NADPH) flavoprotein subunit [Alkalihalobacillus pseudalcaliphilus]KMK76190.1 sulfite reductase [NADPH] flavoprotein alpha-component [Alkalihalobacillus pseudalcaliphilus]
MQLKVTNSPFNQEQVNLLNQLLPTLTETQKAWLSGYISANQVALPSLEAQTGEPSNEQAAVVQIEQAPKEVTILFGSQTGNAQGLAKQTKKKFEEQGFEVTLVSMADYKPNQLKKVENVVILVSTHGEGDPPDTAIAFHEFLHGKRAPKLEGVGFSVLSLGDSSYDFFCQTGKEFDIRLEELGANRVYERVDCDLDYDEPASEWIEGVVSALTKQSNPEKATTADTPKLEELEVSYSRSNPFQAEVLENINLNGRGSNKETRHIEISLEGSGLTYQPGDSLGILPTNDPQYVAQLLAILPWRGNEVVTINKKGDILTLEEALTSYFEITVLTKPLIQNLATYSSNESLHRLLGAESNEELKAYVEGRDLIDFIEDFGTLSGSAQDFVQLLRKIPGRLYSISSSYEANPEEVHVTISTVRYESHGRNRHGVCSVLCAERVELGDKLPVYIQHNENFKLPDNSETPIIMIGPGTGVAPFRAFMQEREEKGIDGKSWIFFGDQHFVTDFLYQTEWQKWVKDGTLTKMDVAFSRDQKEKVYVQHKMLAQSAEFFRWLEEGAFVYVCGDEKNMAHDVHEALLTIVRQEGKLDQDRAKEYVAKMTQEKRYQRDVY